MFEALFQTLWDLANTPLVPTEEPSEQGVFQLKTINDTPSVSMQHPKGPPPGLTLILAAELAGRDNGLEDEYAHESRVDGQRYIRTSNPSNLVTDLVPCLAASLACPHQPGISAHDLDHVPYATV
jgi:hypothetical protein